MAKTYRVGIIGSTGRGDYGHGVDRAFTKLPNMKIVAVADSHVGGRKAAQQRLNAPTAYADYQKMLQVERPDIVAICPRWVDQHHDMLMASAEAGCHVYMEKPFCRTPAECDDVVTALQMRHLKLGIAHVTQYSPVLDTVMRLIKGGEIGDVLELRGRGKEDRRGGAEDLWVLGSHIFGMMKTVAGGDPDTCTALMTQNGQPVTAGHVVDGAEGLGPLAGDRLHATWYYDNGIVGQFASVRNRGGSPSRFALQIFGSKGVIEIQSGYLKPAFILKDSGWSPGRSGQSWQPITSAGIGQPEPRDDGTYEGGHIAAIRDLVAGIEQERPTKCSAEDARSIVEMICSVFEAHRTGGPVRLPLSTRANPLTLLEA
ncbi:MAG: Gfo/Idh/MocA family oxidoreductase [Fuerstiella sp.]